MPEEFKKIVEILGTAYLYRKAGIFPSQKNINSELQRREKWLKSIQKKYSGEEAFKKISKEIWMDPPQNFN